MSQLGPADDSATAWMEHADALIEAMPGWLETRRWFADKGRGIAGVGIEGALSQDVIGDDLVLAIVRVTFRAGEDARYFIPVAWTQHPEDVERIAMAPLALGGGAFIEAIEAGWFGRWLMEAMLGAATEPGDRWSFAAYPKTRKALLAARSHPATIMRAEQSNTSLQFDDEVMVKLVRRLQPGPNPEAELLRALGDAGFRHVPPLVGVGSWRSLDGETYPIALVQSYVANQGDGWSWMVRRVSDVAATATLPVIGSGSPERLLGKRTGELHAALSRIDDPSLAPESASDATVAANVDRVRAAAERSILLLTDNAPGLPASVQGLLPTIIDRLGRSVVRTERFDRETGTSRIRVHGDFHLGQTLRTSDDDWAIIDFEGEPARPVAERRQKTSALKDVAGMLRSFAYARGAVERDEAGNPTILAAWEAAAREAFLSGYREALGDASTPLVPVDDQAFRDALAAWEMDKALYEIAYEVRNRPDWVELPLRSLMPEAFG